MPIRCGAFRDEMPPSSPRAKKPRAVRPGAPSVQRRDQSAATAWSAQYVPEKLLFRLVSFWSDVAPVAEPVVADALVPVPVPVVDAEVA